jgi:hypothetical protein
MNSWPALGGAWRTLPWSRLAHSVWQLPGRLSGMLSLRLTSIKAREYVAGTVVCLLLLAAVPDLWGMWRSLFPIPAPMVVEWSEGHMMANGLWRLERELTISERCSTVVWRRWFRAEGSDDVEMPAVASSTDSLSPIALGGRRDVGTYADWWDYAPVPGLKGVRITTVTFAQCPSGYEGVLSLYVTPFDWTGVAARN